MFRKGLPGKGGYRNIDRQSATLKGADKKKGILRITMVVLVIFIVVVTGHLKRQLTKKNDKDNLFTAMLMDDQGFYFPTLKRAPIANRARALQQHGGTLWSFDWKQNIGASSAIGEYYRAKGMALTEYYKSLSNSTSAGLNTVIYDWRSDEKRGKDLGEMYTAIGDAIDEHYQLIYSKKALKGKSKHTNNNMPSYDWMGDSDNGLTIGNCYHELGSNIRKHYEKTAVRPQLIQDPAAMEWTPEQWEEYKQQGEDIAAYYHKKGKAVENYYKGRYADMWPNLGSADPIRYRNEMKSKGSAITEYYRAKYDTTYEPDKFAKQDKFPPWGQDPEADREHGQAIGAYYRKHNGNLVGQFYEQHGKEIGKYFENYYRTIFDPTYDASAGFDG